VGASGSEEARRRKFFFGMEDKNDLDFGVNFIETGDGAGGVETRFT